MDLNHVLFLPIEPGPRPRGPEDEPVGEDEAPEVPRQDGEEAKKAPTPDANPIDPRVFREED